MLFNLLTLFYDGSAMIAGFFSTRMLIILLGTFMCVSMHAVSQIILVYSNKDFKMPKVYRIAIFAHYLMWIHIIRTHLYDSTFLSYLIFGSIIVFIIVNNIIDLRDVFELDKSKRNGSILFNSFIAILALASGLTISSKIIFSFIRDFFGLLIRLLY